MQGAVSGPSSLNNLLVIVLAVAGLAIAGGYWFITNRKLAEREDTLSQRQAEAQKLEAVIKNVEEYQKRKDDLQKRIDLINQLKQNQKGPVRIMDQISRDLPDLVWLDTMTVNAGKLSLTGRALNPNAIATFVTNIKGDPYFEEPNLGSVTQSPGTPPLYVFDMDFAFTYTPKVTGAAGAGGATGTAGTTGTAATTAAATAGKK
jgi:type IV pilus assembly protein PilN